VRQLRRYRARRKALSLPITIEQVTGFDLKLVPVAYGNGTCWLYPSGKGTPIDTGRTVYSNLKFNGQTVTAHRFALAVKEGCTMMGLENYDAAHAPVSVCMGGRCCNPDHLCKKPVPKNRSFDRIGTGLNGPRKPRPELVSLMYPVGLYSDGKMFDEPWQSNASSALIRFLELGLKSTLLEMQKVAFGPHRERG
jgi:hypothetical protein